MPNNALKLLFIINPGAGKNKTDWKKEIQEYFTTKSHTVELYELPQNCDPDTVKKKIKSAGADRVIAVGGDGTLKLVADTLEGSDIPIGLLPAGSANGMAKELGIPADPAGALDVIVSDHSQRIHMVRVNDELCIHLSDIGFNAFVVKKFEDEGVRGMWGYIKAAWKVLLNHDRMQVEIKVDDKYIRRDAAMVVIANATKYGTGVLINPEGKLDDELFEVIIVKRISLGEIFKMRFTHRPYHPEKTEVLTTRSLKINSRHHVHFQVDGEYLGKTKSVKAEIIPGALRVLIPEANAEVK
ncbi:MAG: YegS/Rv2252/BmrU family lipid kinase [Chitinophagaceae bacterium]